MEIFIKLELNDVNTGPFGGNFYIRPENGPFVIILSPDAAKELQKDLAYLLNKQENVDENQDS